MKKYTYCMLMILGIITIQSCTKDFVKDNTDPNSSPKPVPGYIFTKAEYDGVSSMPDLLLGTMQYTTSFNDVAGFGSKYILAQAQQSAATFTSSYPNQINELVEVLKATTGDPSQINLVAEARIWRAYCFGRLTDLYGDIPYSQAGQGYNSGIYKPAYDAQKDIYADMLKELDEAATSLDASKATFGDADLIYGGKTDQWRKFAYSLMLRYAMRMTKVDINAAQTWATKAIAGGVILEDADIAKVPYVGSGQDINKNPLANDLWNSDYIAQDGVTNTEGGKYQDVFINYLKTNKDPRLGVISIVYNNGVADTSFALQQGMSAMLNTKPVNFGSLSEPNPKTVLLLSSPRLVFTAAESYFLLAEAAARGWYSGSTASVSYTNGIAAAMRQWAIIGGAPGTITDNQINVYIANHPYNAAGTLDQQMDQIYTEFWVGIFPDAEEAFSSYRRTGYPALVPNNYTGNATGGKIFRRLLYPISEQNLNAASYNAAISRQGPDDFLTRIWWDKQ
ncbi:MAG: SusD/RagB family nutrient-binding outer membrane lipoprotein [Bacteroidetes bacterium]|nr:SusD/RagB family nutrient-binding outer membrane lipoprotein [Bacteroidota bacterium]